MESLVGERYINFATFRRSGVAVETPVWFAPLEGKLYLFTSGTAGKVKRLRNSPRSRVAACDVRGRLHGEWIDATARIVEEPETIKRAYEALRAKYGLQMWLTDFFSKLTGRIDKRAIVEIELAT
jgi:PPOX class probable F420-dependent enzyme